MLHIFDSIRGISFAAVLIKLLLAFAIGTIIGLERSYHNKPAGFRTHILVVLGASIASLTGIYLYVGLNLPTDVSRIAAGVVTGLGFIGAGTIIVTRKLKVKGLTTAAGLWTSGLIGLAVGSSYYHREDLDRVMRYCKDNSTVITDLRITGSKDSQTAMYNALITLKSDNDLDQEEFASQIEHMSGIISAQLI